MSVRAWRIRLPVLTVVVLFVGTLQLGAQDQTPQDRRTTVTRGSPGSEVQTHSQHEFEAISWDTLLDDMKAELKVNEPDIDRVPDGHRKSILSIECLGKTDEKHGFKRLPWDQRKTRRIELFEVDENKYLVVKAEEYVEVKAPWGDWRLEEESSRGVVRSPAVGQVITGELP